MDVIVELADPRNSRSIAGVTKDLHWDEGIHSERRRAYADPTRNWSVDSWCQKPVSKSSYSIEISECGRSHGSGPRTDHYTIPYIPILGTALPWALET